MGAGWFSGRTSASQRIFLSFMSLLAGRTFPLNGSYSHSASYMASMRRYIPFWTSMGIITRMPSSEMTMPPSLTVMESTSIMSEPFRTIRSASLYVWMSLYIR